MIFEVTFANLPTEAFFRVLLKFCRTTYATGERKNKKLCMIFLFAVSYCCNIIQHRFAFFIEATPSRRAWWACTKNKREANHPFSVVFQIFTMKIDRNSSELYSTKMNISYSCSKSSYCCAFKIPWSFKSKEIGLSDQVKWKDYERNLFEIRACKRLCADRQTYNTKTGHNFFVCWLLFFMHVHLINLTSTVLTT